MRYELLMKNSLICKFIQEVYKHSNSIPLHEPIFTGLEREYVLDTLASTFVSSVGEYVTRFEQAICSHTGSPHAVAVTNGTSALHLALQCTGVQTNDLVITQSFTFVATCNAIAKLGARPIFCDISTDTLSLCPSSLSKFLSENAYVKNKQCFLKQTNQRIKAVLPVHTFGHPGEITELVEICHFWKLELIEDAAEALGSTYKKKHVGTFGRFGIISFNGNKIITTGAGGVILCQNAEDAKLLRHISSTGKIPHKYQFFHDIEAFNFRMPNINAALGLAQIENLELFLKSKKEIATSYEKFFLNSEIKFFKEPIHARSNYWLNAIAFQTADDCNSFLEFANENGISARAAWTPMHHLPMYRDDLCDNLANTDKIAKRIANIPSSPLIDANA